MNEPLVRSSDNATKLPELRWWWVVAAAVLTAALIAGMLWLLLAQVRTYPSAESARAQLDAIRTALSIGLGAGGAFALWLAARKQRSTEIQIREAIRASTEEQAHRDRTHFLTELDLTERRITENYTKAVEQLGASKAPVRLGGLYALERLGNTTPDLRQTIVNVVCAYLRMPFPQPPWEHDGPAIDLSGDVTENELRGREELQVRLTAQRILSTHLRELNENPTNWGPLNIDLSDAVLIDFRLIGCSVGKARFHRARFLTVARFDDTEFHGDVWFYESAFELMSFFYNTTFHDDAVFTGAQFGWNFSAQGVHFCKDATFYMTTYCGLCDLRDSRFDGNVRFDRRSRRRELAEGIEDTPIWCDIDGTPFNFCGAQSTNSSPDVEKILPDGWQISTDGSIERPNQPTGTLRVDDTNPNQTSRRVEDG